MNLPTPNKQKYLNAYPFPHIVVDGAFDCVDLTEVVLDWPHAHSIVHNIEDQVHKGHTEEPDIPSYISHFIKSNFLSHKFITWLEDLTGINGLVTDKNYGQGGLHEIYNKGYLRVHTDYTKSGYTGLDRRVNVILYLNENWDYNYNGKLELWSGNPNRENSRMIDIMPIFNRMVIFNTTDNSWHGHPKPLKTPEGVTRKSIALYYFSQTGGAPENRTIFIDQDSKLKKGIKLFIPPLIWKISKLKLRKVNSRIR